MKNVTKDIFYVGVNDHDIDLFEGHFEVPNGMAYNSYIIVDEKVAIMDSVEINFVNEWLQNIKEVLGERKPDYLVIQHMEPDHSSSLMEFLKVYPDTVVVGNSKTFQMMKQFFFELPEHTLEVKENDELNLGKHSLRFVFAPMVHWPEVMMTFDSYDKVLFTADAFGKFGALDYDDPEGWACEARRYYFGIVGKYGVQVQALFRKLNSLDNPIEIICPLHGPVLDDDLGYYLHLYNIWSSYGVESDGVALFYTSVYGHTKEAVEYLASELRRLGCPKVVVNDLARTDINEDVEDAFRYGKVVFATTTYNMSIFPFMNDFLTMLVERLYQNKTVGLIGNGSWAPVAVKVLKEKIAPCKNLTILEPEVTILSRMNEENKVQLTQLAEALMK